MIYGACTPIGQKLARLLCNKKGYNLMLIDTDLNKLNTLKADLLTTAQVRILPINFSMLRDSTKLEHRLFKMIFDREPLKVN